MDDSSNLPARYCGALNSQQPRFSRNRSAPEDVASAGEFELEDIVRITDEELAKFETIDLGNEEPSVDNTAATSDSGQLASPDTRHSDETLPILNVERSRWKIRRKNYPRDTFCDFNVRVSKIVYAKFFIPFWVLLLALPISAGIMGAKYLGDCPFGQQYPCIFMAMGITGVTLIIGRILLILHNTTWEERIKRKTLQLIVLFSCLLTLLAFGMESIPFIAVRTSDDPSSKDYCNPSFTLYATSVNWIILLIAAPFLLFTASTCCSYYELVKNARSSMNV